LEVQVTGVALDPVALAAVGHSDAAACVPAVAPSPAPGEERGTQAAERRWCWFASCALVGNVARLRLAGVPPRQPAASLQGVSKEDGAQAEVMAVQELRVDAPQQLYLLWPLLDQQRPTATPAEDT
jgi:hypothetical protein